MEPLKNLYNDTFFDNFTGAAKRVIPGFNTRRFLKDIYDSNWDNRELKQRMRHIATVLHSHLQGNYMQQLPLMLSLVDQLREMNVREQSVEFMCLPDFIECYGLDDLSSSLDAMETLTQFTSCEYAIRPFLQQYQDAVLARVLQWSRHDSHHVRRLSSEGCRPRLPWAMALPALKRDPAPIIPILENLRQDESEYVRRSVANNLNDIAKDHPELVLTLAAQWIGKHRDTDRLLKHGCRNLLRQAHPAALSMFGMSGDVAVKVNTIALSEKKLHIGGELLLEFILETFSDESQQLRIEYGVYYIKSNGSSARKLFKITENNYAGHSTFAFSRKLRFKDLTTRTHYQGKHIVSVVVNGNELAQAEFHLLR